MPKDTAVSYEVSKGKEIKEVYIGNAEKNGSSESAVTAYLTGLGLQVTREEQYHNSIPRGNVISYSPGNGSLVAPGSTVKVIVSIGPKPVEKVTVPSVKGMDTASAANTLSASGFSLGTVTKGDTMATKPSDNGKIYAQSVEGQVDKGRVTAVNVTIYKDHAHSEKLNDDGSITCSLCNELLQAAPTPPNPPQGSGSTNQTGP